MKRIVGIGLLLIGVLVKAAFANPALAELNALIAKKSQHEQQQQKVQNTIKELQEQYYFIFIYRSTCPHCHQFAPVVKDFSDTFHIPLRAYSLDGQPLIGLSAELLTPALFKTLYVSGGYKPSVPALYLVHKDTDEAYAVLFGEAQPVELAQRVDTLMRHIQEKYHD
jgi:type-F conjugative transfer system pilin assembly thiol-disulfide isomerase TrbB